MRALFLFLSYAIFSALLTSGAMCLAANGPGSRKVKECFEYLQGSGGISKVQPFIPWEALSNVRRHGQAGFNWIGELNENIFVKAVWINHIPRTEFFDQVTFSKELSDAGVGAKFIGTTLDQFGHWGIIYEFVPGQSYMPDYDFSKEENHSKSWEVVRPNKNIPSGIVITEATVRDVNSAFDALNRLKIDAEDIEFILTPQARAVLIDYGAFFRSTSAASARKHNDALRKAVVAGLEANLHNDRSNK